jgi:surface-anchored protein
MRILFALSLAALIFTSGLNAATLSGGHVDLRVRYHSNTWTWDILDEDFNSLPLVNSVLAVNSQSYQVAPDDALFTPILGLPGSPVYILPQQQTGNLLFLGLDGSATGNGVMLNNQIHLELLQSSGPGEVSVYTVDAFGAPEAYFNTRDGITAADRITLSSASGHSHFAWAFSAPGNYSLSVRPTATLAAGNTPLTGPPVTWNFSVIPEPTTALTLGLTCFILLRRTRYARHLS